MLRRGQAVFDAEIGAELVELVFAGGGALAQTKEAVGKLFSVIGQNGADAQRAGPLQVAQEPAGVGSGLGVVDTNEHPAGCPPLVL